MEKIAIIKKSFNSDLNKADSREELERIKIKYLGRKGEIIGLSKTFGSLSASQKKDFGRRLNGLKKRIEAGVSSKERSLKGAASKAEAIDITAPGSEFPEGHLHPVTLVYRELFEIFKGLGFSIADGPEVESDWYSFEALNIPKNHPARDFADTFYISEEVNLRPHTSNVQIHYMENHKPPLRVVAYGRTYRRDSDMTHTPMFHQLEGLLVDTDVTMADLKGTLNYFVKKFFGSDRKTRFRPHHFPFTEPSAEVDVSCGICGGKGCRSCKYSGWLEILGAGMVHPQVLKKGGIDPKKYQGFAFGVGIERLAMLKYNIDDLRLFFEGDLRFINQF